MSESELIGALRKQLEEDTAADGFAGSVLVAKNGNSVFAQAYGLADREHKAPNSLTTRFRIDSMNKMFTATATLQLAQAGKLGLDDPLGKYLTDYPNKDIATKVTIKQLLTHTGGTGDIFGPEFDAHRLELRTLQDYVKLYGNRGPQFEPGSRWEYSNYGFVLLGLVIEKVSGQNYYDYVREHIYQMAGMTSSGSESEDQPVADRSIGYTKVGADQWHPNTDTLPYRGTSAGGGYSTVEDLLRFANALQNHKLLNTDYTELLTVGKVDTPRGRYGYGFGDQTINGTRCFGHSGGAPGMNGDLEICPGPGYVIAVLANMDPPAAGRVSDFITNRLPQR
jgi:CubicO group peptidase (beta-lactamase class C family)